MTLIRRALPYVTRVSGGFLVLAGLYVAWYGWWEVRINRGELVDDPIANVGETVRDNVNGWINDVGATTLAGWFVGALVVALGASLLMRRRRGSEGPPPDSAPAPEGA